jgi:hypothetical protein
LPIFSDHIFVRGEKRILPEANYLDCTKLALPALT